MPRPTKNDPAQLLLFGKIVSLPGGEFKIVPGLPTATVSATQAAEYLGVSKHTVYRLCEMGALKSSRPTPGRILIDAASLQEHKCACSDPEYWENIFKNLTNPSQVSQVSQAS